MSKEFDRLLRRKNRESLIEAYELLWAHYAGRGGPPRCTSEFDTESVRIDWDGLEKIALRKTPIEALGRGLARLPRWAATCTVMLVLLSVPVALVLTYVWARAQLAAANPSRAVAVAGVIVVVVSLCGLTVGISVTWFTRLFASVRSHAVAQRRESILAQFKKELDTPLAEKRSRRTRP